MFILFRWFVVLWGRDNLGRPCPLNTAAHLNEIVTNPSLVAYSKAVPLSRAAVSALRLTVDFLTSRFGALSSS